MKNVEKKKNTNISIYLSYLLRHNPDLINLDMDKHGWVDVTQLISNVNAAGQHTLSTALLREIVDTDSKGRYRISSDGKRIKACQGHSISWVEPELEAMLPPQFLYHGTNTESLVAIMESGAIQRMGRHAVHMQADIEKAWKSAKRWKGKKPVVIKIAAAELAKTGMAFGKSENNVWCCNEVPTPFFADVIYTLPELKE